MTNCRKTAINTTCGTKPLEGSENSKASCQTFSACLPFGARLSYNGDCLNYTAGTAVADGEYGIVVVEGGCITGVRPAPVQVYTPPPCTPAVQDCSGSGGTQSIVLQPDTCNLLTQDASGRIGGYINTIAGDNITVSGCGSLTSPLIISATVPTADRTYIGSEDVTAIRISGTGLVSDPYIVGMVESPLGAGTYGAFTVDKYGRIVEFDEEADTGIQAIIAGPGVNIAQSSGVATVGLATVETVPGNYLLGGYYVTTDVAGRVTAIEQGIAVPADVYDLRDYRAQINQYGSVVALQAVSRTNDLSFSKLFTGQREATSFYVNTSINGHIRVRYLGDLGTATASSTGLVPAPAPWRVLINNVAANTYARIVQNGSTYKIVELHVITAESYPPGSYLIEVAGNAPTDAQPYPFSDTAILDVEFVSAGT